MTAPTTTPAKVQTEETRRRALLERLERFTACCWETASLDRAQMRFVWELSAKHGAAPIMLSSCQRIEVYGSDICECEAPLRREGIEALRHLAEVAAGLHSVVLGEAQILGQVRTAVQEAPPDIRPIAGTAVAAARELRRETEFHSHSGHLLDRALGRADVPASGHLLVVGAGAVGRLIAQRGKELGFEHVTIASRREPDAAWFRDGGFAFRHLQEMQDLAPVDVVVGCLGSNADELRPDDHLPEVRRLIVDLGTPRNFANHDDVPLVTIAAMLGPGNERPHGDAKRAALRERLHEILDRRLMMMSQNGESPVGNLRKSVEAARQRELEAVRQRHPEIPAETLDAITRSMINKIFHAPSQRLKQLDDPELAQELAALFAHNDSASAMEDED